MDFSKLTKKTINVNQFDLPENLNRRLKKIMDYDRKPNKLNKTKNYKSAKRLMKDCI